MLSYAKLRMDRKDWTLLVVMDIKTNGHLLNTSEFCMVVFVRNMLGFALGFHA